MTVGPTQQASTQKFAQPGGGGKVQLQARPISPGLAESSSVISVTEDADGNLLKVFDQNFGAKGGWRDYNATTDAMPVLDLVLNHSDRVYQLGGDRQFHRVGAGPNDEWAAKNLKDRYLLDDNGKQIGAVMKVNGQDINSVDDLRAALAAVPPGSQVTFAVLGNTGSVDVTRTVGTAPQQQQQKSAGAEPKAKQVHSDKAKSPAPEAKAASARPGATAHARPSVSQKHGVVSNPAIEGQKEAAHILWKAYDETVREADSHKGQADYQPLLDRATRLLHAARETEAELHAAEAAAGLPPSNVNS